jgi:hypothetical protein
MTCQGTLPGEKIPAKIKPTPITIRGEAIILKTIRYRIPPTNWHRQIGYPLMIDVIGIKKDPKTVIIAPQITYCLFKHIGNNG